MEQNSRSIETWKRVAIIAATTASSAAIGAGTGGIIGTAIAGPPGGVVGAVVGDIIGGTIGGITAVTVISCKYDRHHQWVERIESQYGEGDIIREIPSALTLKEQLLSVFEKDGVLKKYIDPITGNLIQYPFRHPVDKNFYDLKIYRKLIADPKNCPPNYPDPGNIGPRCPYTKAPMSSFDHAALSEDIYVQAVICNRLVELIEEVHVEGVHEEVITGLNELKLDFDKVRNELFERCKEALQKKKDNKEITMSEFNKQMLGLSQRFYADSQIPDAQD